MALGAQIGELALLCDGANVARKTLASVSRAPSIINTISDDGTTTNYWQNVANNEASGAGAVDGTLEVKYYDINGSPTRAAASPSPEGDKQCYVQLSYSAAQRVTGYAWATANDFYDVAANNCRSPKSFRLQGSDDGETWTDIDVQENFTPPSAAYTWARPIPVGGATDAGGYTTDAKWFRIRFRKKRADNQTAFILGELALYDADGNRVNGYLENSLSAALEPGQATALSWNATGTAGWSSLVGTSGNSLNTFNSLPSLFDGQSGGSLNTYPGQATIWHGVTELTTNVNVVVLMRLKDNAAPVASYRLQSGNTNNSCWPAAWALEAGFDGENWFLLDEREPEDVSAANTWWNGPLPYFFNRAVASGAESTALVVGAFDRDGGAMLDASSVEKVGAGDAVYAGGNPAALDVKGGSLEILPKFTSYRFKVEDICQGMNIDWYTTYNELAFFDGATNVTQRDTEKLSYGPRAANYETQGWALPVLSRLVDFNRTDGSSQYRDYNAGVKVTAEERENAWVRCDYDEPVRVTSLAFLSGETGGANGSTRFGPDKVRLQGSNDGGATWTDLDYRAGIAVDKMQTNRWVHLARPEYVGRTLASTSAKYLRFTVLEQHTHTEQYLAIQELYFYDADGNRVGQGIAWNQSAAAASELAAGQCFYTCNNFTQTGVWSEQSPANLFDGVSTKFLIGHGNQPLLWQDRNIAVTILLPDGAADIASYNLLTATDAATCYQRNPESWLLEASEDGETWFTLDFRHCENSPRVGSTLYNGGTPYTFSKYRFGEDAPQFESVSLAGGASLTLNERDRQISSLTVDCSGEAASIDVVNFAPDGALYLVGREGSISEYAVPLEIGTIVNPQNLSSWKVYVDGVLRPRAKPTIEDGGIFLPARGFTVFLR